MIQSWKQRLIGGIALTAAIVLGSTMAATSVRADHARSWEGAVVGGVIGGLIGSTVGKRHDRLAAVSIAAVLGTLYGGQFTAHHRHAGWYHRPLHHQRQWHRQRVRQQPWYVHPQRLPSSPVAPSGFTSGPGTCILNRTINASGTASGFMSSPGTCILNGTSIARGTASGFMSSPGTCILNGTSIARGTASGFMSSPGTCILNGTSIVMTTDGSGRAPTP